MLTAAVRDLHRCYPDQFVTDVRTSCPELWYFNPYLTSLEEKDPEVTVLDCVYPLIHRANELPYHCLHGFIAFLNEQLGLSIRPTLFQGDLHLSDLEKNRPSQVEELSGRDLPFWIVVAGGTYACTIKWWEKSRYQEVVDRYRGRIQFVQVGRAAHYHPGLEGVIDLRGRTDLRQLTRLVYHAQGILCPVTLLMHLAAAVETKPGQAPRRACVVLAGGREPVHWEAYPQHQFMHTIGALPCCSHGGCWRSRTHGRGDGDFRDEPGQLCLDVSNGLPRCMEMVTPEMVAERIGVYFAGGAARYLTGDEARAGEMGVARSRTAGWTRFVDDSITLSQDAVA